MGWDKCNIEVESVSGGREGFWCEWEVEEDFVEVSRKVRGNVLGGGIERV